MDEMTKKKIHDDVSRQADANEMRRQIDLLLLTLEATRSALIKEEVRPGENPFAKCDKASYAYEMGKAMVEADVVRRKGIKEGAIAAFEYAIKLVNGIVKEKAK